MSFISHSALKFTAQSNNSRETGQPGLVNSAFSSDEDDEDDIVFIDSSDIPRTSWVETDEGTHVSRIDLCNRIRGLEGVRTSIWVFTFISHSRVFPENRTGRGETGHRGMIMNCIFVFRVYSTNAR